MNRWNGKAYGAVPKTIIALIGLVVGLLSIMSLISFLGRAGHDSEKTAFHTLPAAPRILTDAPEKIVIEDKSPYAFNKELALRQYLSCSYMDGQLVEETGYDEQGVRTLSHTLEYDTAGNLLRERIQEGEEALQTQRHIYEYDDAGRIVHEKIYWDKKLVKDNYFRYTNEGCAGVSYSYLNEQIQGGISQHCADHTEFVEDTEGNMLCAFQMNALLVESPTKIWKMQWQKQGERLLNRVQYYKDAIGIGRSHTKDWYLQMPRADVEQLNLYQCMPETAEKNLTLQLNYEWTNDSKSFALVPSFYRARYDGDRLLWQLNYVEGGIAYYSACRYDAKGRLLEAVDYSAEGEKPEALFHRYEYPEEDRQVQYVYAIQGQAFAQDLGEGACVRLTFSGEGVLSGIEMTNTSENDTETYAFEKSGHGIGKLLRMQTGSETTEGETAVLKKLEKEVASYGMQVGEDLTDGSGVEGGKR